jgi:hypothetical protein
MPNPYEAPRAELSDSSVSACPAVREIRFSWTRADIFLGCLVAFYRRPIFALIALAPGILVVRDEFWGHLSELSLPQLAVIAIAYVLVPGVLLWGFSLVFGGLITALRPGKMPGVLGEHLIRFGPEGIYEETSVNASTFAWSGVRFLRRSVFGVLIQLAGSSWLVPRRYFHDGAEMEEIVRQANVYVLAARVA